MKKSQFAMAVVIAVLLLAATVVLAQDAVEKGKHEAVHHGCLNVIGGECEKGHMEVKLTDGLLEAWLVGGGQDTNRSVRIDAQEIHLNAKLPDGTTQELVLQAKPLDLAGEKLGDCSHFTASADWLKTATKFEATGEFRFRGQMEKLIVRYPQGYDPDEEVKEHKEK